ncbi:MAG: VanZ family protein [Lachnospiraceae bacterium]
MKKLLRYLSVLPALLMLFLIFCFSAQDGDTSGSLSFRLCCAVIRFVDRTFSLSLTETEVLSRADSIHFLVRKAAHMTEYFLLTLSIFLPLRVWLLTGKDSTRKTTIGKILLFTLLLSIAFAVLDEFHQVFVPGRCGTPKDVLIDSIGILIACLLLLKTTAGKKGDYHE